MSSPILTIRDVHFSRPENGFQLVIPQFTASAGESVLITGRSGTGKTTLLHILAGILPVSLGCITVQDSNVSQMSDRDRRAFRLRQIGLIFQSFELIDYLSVLDNVLLPARISPAMELTPDVKRRANQLLSDVGLDRYSRQSVTRLSQGERQRVAICRALLPNPSLLLADEPTGNLDPETSSNIVRILLERVAADGATLLMVSHDHSLIPRFDTAIDIATLTGKTATAAGDSSAP